MLWPDSIVLAGVSIPLASVVADVTIHHGRSDVFEDPSASTCQLTFHEVTHAFARSFKVGATLVLTARNGAGAPIPRFTGKITDATLDVAELTAIAVSQLATLGQYPIGTGVWPVETWSARVNRIFAEAGLASSLEFYPDPTFDPQLAARDPATAGETTLGDYLAFLAPMLGAAVADRPDGKILVQALGARSLESRVALDPADVEYAPAWQQVLPLGNVVTVRYTGDQSMSVTVSEPESIAQYGHRPSTVDTSFVNVADASARAETRLSRGAYAHWNIPETPIVRPLALSIGTPLELSSMPPASPFDPWMPILEGWTDTIHGEEWSMRLALSDPLASGLLLPWDTLPASDLWTTINQTVPWNEAFTLEDLQNA